MHTLSHNLGRTRKGRPKPVPDDGVSPTLRCLLSLPGGKMAHRKGQPDRTRLAQRTTPSRGAVARMDSLTQTPRKAISRRLRFEILRRDNHTCRYCGLKAGAAELTVDHVVPIALGGTDDPSNLVAACKDCNAGKSSSSPDAAVVDQASADALRWSAAMQVAIGLAMDEAEKLDIFVAAVDAAWLRWGDGVIPRPSDWSRSVRTWGSMGLPTTLITDAIDLAMTNRKVEHPDVWRYTCGIVWKRIAQLRDDAERLLAEGAV